ncbi:hypothetical protein HK098_006228 [Nowakowskiella sp. JEL0407]|nr:hypothetical protein HK098_006228 [Nowakowskiella sp. JEL0407]
MNSTQREESAPNLPWVEKYRPKNMDDISSHSDIVNVLRASLASKNLPHLLFYGPPGTGKTSTILALANELYGPTFMKSRVLELNASDERGIDVIREKVKSFAKTTVTQSAPGYPSPPYKIIILDEADSMTTEAQSALRRTMETYSKITRFCLICNYVSKIIDPLMSRCAKFRFKPLDDTSVMDRILTVARGEGVICDEAVAKSLVEVSGGDLRKAIMYLQTASTIHENEPILLDSVAEIAGVVPEDVVTRVIKTWQSKRTGEIEKIANEIIRSGFSVAQLFSQISDRLVVDPHVTSKQKAKAFQVLGKSDFSLLTGADEHLQLLNTLLQLKEVIA